MQIKQDLSSVRLKVVVDSYHVGKYTLMGNDSGAPSPD